MPPVFKPLMPLDEAWSHLQAALGDRAFGAGSVQSVASVDALGRVLAADVTSGVDVPPLDNSAMDGYAVAEADLEQLAQPGSTLKVVQRLAAGQVGGRLEAGTCARIFTGAPIPGGTGAVVMQEHVEALANGSVVLSQPVKPAQNIRRRGEDIAAGSQVLTRGRCLTPATLGVAASVGEATLSVYAKPRVGVLATGSELVMPGQPLPPGAIYNSNRHTLIGLAQACGADVGDLGLVPDDLAATRAALRAAAETHDLIITSGGVSVGEEDHLRAAVEAEGALSFWALAIKPGKPFVFGRINRSDGSHALYMGLPGNPVASYVTFLLLVRPVLGVLAGEGWHLPRAMQLEAGFDWPRADKRREFLRGRLNDQGQVTLFNNQGSGVLSSAAWAEGLVDLAPGQTVKAGDKVRWLSLPELIQPAKTTREGA